MAEDKEKGIPLFKTACISPTCTSSDGLQIYQHEHDIRGYCYVCDESFYNIDLETMTPMKQPQQTRRAPTTLGWVLENSTIAEIPSRGLRKDILEEFGVRVGYDNITGEIDTHYYPLQKGGKLTGYKVRDVATKHFHAIGDTKGCELFGQIRSGSGGKLLIITEGELDAVAATQMLRDRGKNYRVISLSHGANDRSVKVNLEYLETFDTVFLALDQDDAGREAEKSISLVLPHGRVKLMRFSEKDPCDMLMADKAAEFFNSIWSAQDYRPDGIVSVDDIFEEAIKPVVHGLSWPWETLTRITYGYRRGEIYGFGAGSGCGKTEGFKEIVDHIINVHDLPVGLIFLEEPAHKTLKVLAGKRANKRFHIPEAGWEVEELITEIKHLRGKVYLYNHFGSKDWENIKSKIKYMVHTLGIKDIFLDHLTALVAQENDEYKALNRIMEEMASLVQELDCTIFYISHLRKAQGTPHEEGGHVSADQFKGSGAIVFWSNFLFGYERDQQADDEVQRNTTKFRVLKDRNTGLATGVTFDLYYNHDTGRWIEYSEVEDEVDIL